MYEEETENYVEEMKKGTSSILVVVRVRPLNARERSFSAFETTRVLDGKLIALVDPGDEDINDVLRKNRSKQTQYAFDFVFDQSSTTKNLYDRSIRFLLDGVFDGYNATILAYGATSCGKTYTMVGNPESTGIMPLTIIDLLTRYHQLGKYKQIGFRVSYLEIYNENIKDLLISEDRNFDLREDPKEGVTIPGITQITILNIGQLKTVLKVGSKNRTNESTGANDVSSRSHAILQIHIEVKEKAQSTIQQIQVSKLCLVDLAGSQRASNTTNRGQRMIEGAKINQSLLVLGNCIQALSEGKKNYVPYRGSKLTRLLKDSLGGNCRTVMIAHLSPSVQSFEDTYNTLLYAHRAKNIKNNVTRNSLNAETHLSNYSNIIHTLKKQNQELKAQLRSKSLSKNKSSLPNLQNYLEDEIKRYEERINTQFSTEARLMNRVHEIDIKMQMIAFRIYKLDNQQNKDEKQLKNKTIEAQEISKQRSREEKGLLQVVNDRQTIIHELKANQKIGRNCQFYLLALVKEKNAQIQAKASEHQRQMFKVEKKQLKSFMQEMQKQLKNKEKIIQEQKVIIEKNNIKNRITFSQLNIDQDQFSFTPPQETNIKDKLANIYAKRRRNSNKTSPSSKFISPLKKIRPAQFYEDKTDSQFYSKAIKRNGIQSPIKHKRSEPALQSRSKPNSPSKHRSPPFDVVMLQR